MGRVLWRAPACETTSDCAQTCPDGGTCDTYCFWFRPTKDTKVFRCVERATVCEQLECPSPWTCRADFAGTVQCIYVYR